MSSQETARLAHVDSLRLIAAGLVVFQHLAEYYPTGWSKPLVALGPGVTGVALFFLISGYVIPFSVRRGLDLRSFAIRRLLRIYPLFLAALALVAIGGWTGVLGQWGDLREADFLRWLANLLLVQEFVGARPILGVSWTLIIELIWYALFAGACWRYKERAAAILGLAVPVTLLVLGVISLISEMRIPLGRPAMIYAAVLGYQAFEYRTGLIDLRRLIGAIALFLAVTWFTNFVSFGVYSHAKITLAQAIGPWTVAPIIFFGVILNDRLRDAKLLSAGLLPMLGAISYSIYLLHPIAIAFARQHLPAGSVVSAAIGLTLALSWAGYRLVERPGIALGRKLAARDAHRMAVPV